MILSMTGYGEAEAKAGRGSVRVEIKGYNSRFIDLKIALPGRLSRFEFDLGKLVRSRVQRGRVEITVKEGRAGLPAVVPVLDLELGKKYAAELRKLARETGAGGEVDVGLLAANGEVLRLVEDAKGGRVVWKAIEQAALRALCAFDADRKREGRQIAKSLLAGNARIKGLLGKVKRLGHDRPEAFRRALERKVAELCAGVPIRVEPERLAQEVAVLAVKTDITEEVSRLEGHLDGFHGAIEEVAQKGKKLDFILQEMSREVNTAGAKSQDGEISRLVVEIKCEIEKLRELAANVE